MRYPSFLAAAPAAPAYSSSYFKYSRWLGRWGPELEDIRSLEELMLQVGRRAQGGRRWWTAAGLGWGGGVRGTGEEAGEGKGSEYRFWGKQEREGEESSIWEKR